MTAKKESEPITRDAFLEIIKTRASATLKREPVEVPEWETTVYIQELTAEQLERVGELTVQGKARISNTIKMLTLCLVDKDGNQLLEEKEVTLLMKHSGKVLLRLVDKAGKINDIDLEAEKKS